MFRLKALVHGDAGVGKSWLGASTPGPRLILDAEGGSHFARRLEDGALVRPPSVDWDPMLDEPPTDLSDNTSVFVRVRAMSDVEQAYKWLASGQHEFRSVVLDSLTDIQLTCRYMIRDGQAKQRDITDMQSWGKLLDTMIELCRQFRNLTDHPTHPLDCVLVIAGSEISDGQWAPQLQGGIKGRISGFFDVIMFLQNESDTITGDKKRRGHIVQAMSWKAKDRTHALTEHYGDYVDDPDIEEMMEVLNKSE